MEGLVSSMSKQHMNPESAMAHNRGEEGMEHQSDIQEHNQDVPVTEVQSHQEMEKTLSEHEEAPW